MLPELAVNRGFMSEFLAAESSCLALGPVEVEGARCALVALRPEEAIPEHVTAKGFRFGHALLGAEGWEVIHFVFEFYGFATYNALISPSDPVAKTVLETMVATGDYFFFALDPDRRGTTAFRSEVGAANLAGLRATMDRIRASTTSEAQYRRAVSRFERRPEPPEALLAWVCRGDADHLDLARDRLMLRPA